MTNDKHHHNLDCLKQEVEKIDLYMSINQKKAIFVMIFCTLLNTTGQVFWKIGLKTASFENISTLFNSYIIIGFFSYSLSSILVIYAFKNGDLSVLYPILATGYVWISIISPIIFNEIMNTWKWLGIFTIISGIIILGKGSHK